MITIQSESWKDYFSDPALWGLWSLHYSTFKPIHDDRMPFGPDTQSYEAHEAAGELEILTVRNDGELIGYCLAVVRRHKHYNCLCAFEDSYFLHPDFRGGGTASKLIDRMNEVCRRRGAVKIYWMTKLLFNLGLLFQRKGAEHQDDVYAMWLN